MRITVSVLSHQSVENAFYSHCCHDQHNCEIGSQADGRTEHVLHAWDVSLGHVEAIRTGPQRANKCLVQVPSLIWQRAADVVATSFVLHIRQLDGRVCHVHVSSEPVDEAAGVNSRVTAKGLALIHLEHRGVVAACEGNGDL